MKTKSIDVISILGRGDVRREDWRRLAHAWTPVADYTLQELAPPGVQCTTCWDHHVCAECLGRYPSACPAGCGDGRCTVCGKGGAAVIDPTTT